MNDKVYWYRGWRIKRLEGTIKGFVGNLFGESKAVILITKSESDLYRVGEYTSVHVTELRFMS